MEDTCNRIWKVLETGYTSGGDILNSSILEISKYSEPKVGTVALEYVHAQKFCSSHSLVSTRTIGGICHGSVLFMYHLIMGRIKPHNRTHAIPRLGSPTLYFRKNSSCNTC